MKPRTPWLWVPTLYFAEGLPYFIVNTISVVILKDLGMDNARLALLTSLIGLPWLVKPLWSPSSGAAPAASRNFASWAPK